MAPGPDRARLTGVERGKGEEGKGAESAGAQGQGTGRIRLGRMRKAHILLPLFDEEVRPGGVGRLPGKHVADYGQDQGCGPSQAKRPAATQEERRGLSSGRAAFHETEAGFGGGNAGRGGACLPCCLPDQLDTEAPLLSLAMLPLGGKPTGVK